MIVSTTECPNCGGKLQSTAGQIIRLGELLWFRSCRCETCNYATEEDGSGHDDYIRNEILRWQGSSVLQVDTPEDQSRALFEEKQALGLNMSDIAHLRQVSVGFVATGTPVEMEWLRQRLEAKGINSHATAFPPTSRA